MRFIALVAAGTFLIVSGAQAAPLSAAGLSGAETTSVQLVQAKKDETVTEKVKRNVKRTWKNMVGYKFTVSCLLTGTSTCTETGKSKSEAQGKCQAAHPLCIVSEAK